MPSLAHDSSGHTSLLMSFPGAYVAMCRVRSDPIRSDPIPPVSPLSLAACRGPFSLSNPVDSLPLSLSVGLFTYFGADPPWETDGRPHKNKFYDNKITNTRVGVKLKNSDYIEITGEVT